MNIDANALFHAIADDTRLRCLMLLLGRRELCVCKLTHAIEAAQSQLSRHLGELRKAGVVVDRRDQHLIHYRINPQLPAWALDVLVATASGVAVLEPFISDSVKLNYLPDHLIGSGCLCSYHRARGGNLADVTAIARSR